MSDPAEQVAAAVAARKQKLEAYRQRMLEANADQDPSNYSPDYSEREGEDRDNDGLTWSTELKQYIVT